MTERPRSLQALDRWMIALTPDGYPGPGNVSVLSVWVRPDLPARVALYLSPAALHDRAPRRRQRGTSPPRPPAPPRAPQPAAPRPRGPPRPGPP